MRETPLTSEELALAKDSLVRSLPAQFETSVERDGEHGEHLHLRPRPRLLHEAAGARLSAVTADDVKAAAEKYVVPEKLIVIAVGDRARIAGELQKLNLGAVETRGRRRYAGYRRRGTQIASRATTARS